MMANKGLLGVVSVLLCCACPPDGAKHGSTTVASSTATSTAAAASSSSVATASASVDQCKVLSKRFDAVLRAAPGTCKKNEDCASYSAGVGKNCGGAIDQASAKKLAAITKEFRAAKCGYTVHCAPRQVFGLECRKGVCAEINEQR